MHRNKLDFQGFRISPVEDFSIFAGFSCLMPEDSDRDLDEFIQQDAERHFKDKIAVTYKIHLIADEFETPLGFATLQNDAIVVENDGDLPSVCGEYPYRSFPAVKIGRFGVHIEFQKNKIGSLFLFMLKKLLITGNRTGCRYITVDARRDKINKVDVTAFYVRNSFEILPCRNKTSKYVPMFFDLSSFTN